MHVRAPGLAALLAVCLTAAGCRPSDARREYPRRPIKLVVPFTPAGGTDTFARIVKKAIDDHQLLPQPLVIINLDGAGGTIGSRRVKMAKPDGYTILILHEAIVTAKCSGKVPYGPESFEPIAGTGKMGLVVAVRDDSPYRDLTDLLRAARRQPETLVFAANLGAPVHFVGLRLEQNHPGATFRFTQTGGGTKRLHAVMGGHADVTAFSIEEFLRYEPEGIRALAYCDTERHPSLPHVATTHEQGIDLTHINMQFWWAPRGTPRPRLEMLGEALQKAMQTDEVRERLARIHADPVFLTGDAMRKEVAERERVMSQVDLRKTQPLPNTALIVLISTVAVGSVSALRSWMPKRRGGPRAVFAPAERPARRFDLAFACAALTVLYAAVLTLEVFPYAPVTAIFIWLTGATLTGFRRRQWIPLAVVALGCAFSLDGVLSVVFDLILPESTA